MDEDIEANNRTYNFDNNTLFYKNESDGYAIIEDDYIFDRKDVRAIFITMYTVVFCCCFFGNLMVILVVTLSRRLRSTTNFFLANLAVADMCVGVFCVFQNLSIYLIPSWVFGDFLCKMYQFVHSLSYTTSIFILVVICTERYFAIIHPITCKQILTTSRLRLVIVAVWATSALYSAPKFIWVQTITNDLGDNQTETICISHRKKYDSELFDIINFCFLYLTPLCIMTVLYTRIAIGLWQSSRGLETTAVASREIYGVSCCSRHYGQRVPMDYGIWRLNNNLNVPKTPLRLRSAAAATPTGAYQFQQFTHLSKNVLNARRRVIRMLIAVVLAFAVCNLPFHARKMWQYWSSNYHGGSHFSTLLTPLTFLITYVNSAANPLLYAFLSRNFRKAMRELLFCNCRVSQKKKRIVFKQNSSDQMPTLLLARRSSTHSTRAPCSSIAVTSSDTYNTG